MRAFFRVACAMAIFATFAAKPAAAEEVICGKDWISFLPYKYASVEVSSAAILIRKSDIERGSLITILDIGFLRVRKGNGWGPTSDEFKMPKTTFLAVRACLIVGEPRG